MTETNTTTKTFTTKALRVIDPEIAKLRQEHRENVVQLKRARQSSAILATIIEKRLPQLTDADCAKLLAAIGPKPVTAPLPPRSARPGEKPMQRFPSAPAQPMPGAVPVMGGRKP